MLEAPRNLGTSNVPRVYVTSVTIAKSGMSSAMVLNYDNVGSFGCAIGSCELVLDRCVEVIIYEYDTL